MNRTQQIAAARGILLRYRGSGASTRVLVSRIAQTMGIRPPVIWGVLSGLCRSGQVRLITCLPGRLTRLY